MAIKIGILAEDISDVMVAQILLKRFSKKAIQTKHRVGKGCGKLRENARRWSLLLKELGCTRLVIIHDLDNFSRQDLFGKLDAAHDGLVDNRFRAVFIPIKEIEAWLLADIEGIRNGLKLKGKSAEIANPESLTDPKKVLFEKIEQMSNGARTYLNTVDNEKIAQSCSLVKLSKKCASILPLVKFATEAC
jgi:hypothetical protein